MKKTTKKAPAKTAAKKTTPVKKIAKEKIESKKAAVVKKPAVKKIETVHEVVKKPARKKEPARIQEPVVVVPQTAPVKVEVAPKVEPVKAKVEEIKEVKTEIKPKEVKPKVVRQSDVLAHGVGRRKTAVARVWLRLGSGKLVINGDAYDKYFTTESARLSVSTPFRIIAKAQHYDIAANVVGGGNAAQADAVRLGFVRALVDLNEDWRSEMRKAGLLTVDSRQKERKKYGQKRARRKFQFVKR